MGTFLLYSRPPLTSEIKGRKYSLIPFHPWNLKGVTLQPSEIKERKYSLIPFHPSNLKGVLNRRWRLRPLENHQASCSVFIFSVHLRFFMILLFLTLQRTPPEEGTYPHSLWKTLWSNAWPRSWRNWRRSDVLERLLLIGCLSALGPPIGCRAADTLAMRIPRGLLRCKMIGKRWYCSTHLWNLRIKSGFLKGPTSVLWIWCIYLDFHGHGLVILGFWYPFEWKLDLRYACLLFA